jgi:diguanylate cyclase (GGDEF)-like protein
MMRQFMTEPVSTPAAEPTPAADTPPVAPVPATRTTRTTAPDPAKLPPALMSRMWLQITVILIGAAGFGWLLMTLMPRYQVTSFGLMVLLGGVSLASGCWGAIRRWRDYQLPLNRLVKLLPQARVNEVPIEELGSIKGGLSPLVPLIQDLLADLRRERVQNTILQEEIRQRVANRTDALERTIGSLKQQATRDVLTGLSNRRALETQLPALFKQCKLSGSDLVVLMIDVDYFKTLNDTLGHAAGDELLKQIGQLIRSSIRQTDYAFRCGGDEFVIVLPGASPTVGRNLSERLRSLVDGLAKTLRVPRAPRLSIGLASMNLTNAAGEQELLAEADKALYAVKAARGTPSRAA